MDAENSRAKRDDSGQDHIPLNDTQRFFAEKNHNLVYKFLHEKNLPASEY